MRRANWKLQPYNGHSTWYTWNASLWLSNEESYYREAQETVRRNAHRPKESQINRLARSIRSILGGETPDGKVRRANYREIAKDFLEAELG